MLDDNGEVIKTEEQIKYEEAHPEEYAEYVAKRLEMKAKRKEKHMDEIKEDLKKMQEYGDLNLDGATRYGNMPKDSAGQKLSTKQILFCRYYVATHNVRQSLRLANMDTAPNKANNMMKSQYVRQYIAELEELRLAKLGFSRGTVQENLAIIANQDIRDYIKVQEVAHKGKSGEVYYKNEVVMKSFEEMNKELLTDEYGEPVLDDEGKEIYIDSKKTKAIKSVKFGDNGQLVVDFHDKLSALKMMTNLLDMESAQKITLNDETHRKEVENSLLNKLNAIKKDKDDTKQGKEISVNVESQHSEEEGKIDE